MADRAGSEEVYVLDLLDRVLGQPGLRQHRFDWLRGDPTRNGGRGRTLPVDSYWPDLHLVVEVYERQHDHPVAHFDKPDRLTVSGVHRGEQRRIYDARRHNLIPAHGLTLLVVRIVDLAVDARGRLLRAPVRDEPTLRAVVEAALATSGLGRKTI